MENEKQRVIIAGSRNFNAKEIVEMALLEQFGTDYNDIELIGGGAKGADKIGKQVAKEYGIPYKEFPADWGTYHNAAGPIRNRQMARYAVEGKGSGTLLAFWDGKSRGTKHMIETAYELDMNVHVYLFEN